MAKIIIQDVVDVIGLGNLLLCYVKEGFIKIGMVGRYKNFELKIAMIQTKNENREEAYEREICTIKLILNNASLTDIFFGRGEKVLKELKGATLEFQ